MKHFKAVKSIADKISCSDLLVVLGDFNLPYIEWECSATSWRCIPLHDSNEFLNELFELSLCQINKIHNRNNRLLDLVFVNDNKFSTVKRAIPLSTPEDLHHPPLEFDVETVSSSNVVAYSPRDKVFCFKKTNFEALRSLLSSINWNAIINNQTVNEGVSAFYSILLSCFEQCVPLSSPKPYNGFTWETPRLKYLKNRKNRLFKKYKQSGTLLSYAQYAEARYRYSRCNKLCYKSYLQNVKARIKSDPKKFFDYVNSKRKSIGFPDQLKYNERVSTTDCEAANLFADFFASVFSNEPFDPSNFDVDVPSLASNISIPIIDEQTVRTYINSLKTSFVCGPDNIPSAVVKRCSDLLSAPLTMLFNLSLKSGEFPDLWKESFIIPLHKNGPKSDVSNYRGIARLSVIPKLFEHIISDQLNSTLQPLISPSQHGFTKNRSTVTNLLEFTTLVTDGFAAGMQTDVTYTDFTKAFDRLCQALVCFKLDKIGFAPLLVKWIESYLSHRSQRVIINNVTSRRIEVTSGVPQGSHLGPMLFNLFINDLPSVLRHCAVFMFADDVKICRSYADPADQALIQEDLDRFSEWCRKSCMSLNLKKCKTMSFSWRRVIPCNYHIQGFQLDHVTEFRDLGVLMDPKLTFSSHIHFIIGKARSMLGYVKRWAKEFNDPYICKLLYTSLVRPNLEYASPVWNPKYAIHSDSIESVQKQFLLFALSYLPWDPAVNLPPYEARLKLINLPTLKSRRTTANVCFMFKLIIGSIDSPNLLSKINFNVPMRAMRTHTNFEAIKLSVRRVNYLDYEPFRSMCKDFNKFYFLVCYSFTTEKIKFSLVSYLNS